MRMILRGKLKRKKYNDVQRYLRLNWLGPRSTTVPMGIDMYLYLLIST